MFVRLTMTRPMGPSLTAQNSPWNVLDAVT